MPTSTIHAKHISFRIYPTKGKRYYEVFIFVQKRSMHRFSRSLVQDGANRMAHYDDFEALCSTFPSTNLALRQRLGVLLFTVATSARSGVVAHEIAHAACHSWESLQCSDWASIQSDSKRSQEKFAHIIGSMTAQYWTNWYKYVKRDE